MTTTAIPVTTRKDWSSDQEVRWCPGCGDYSILAAVQMMMPDLGVRRESTVFLSGIGCAARFPYYMNTYGMHSIHGRAPAIATGLATSRPDLDVWVISGDGDALSIGGNHLIHALRRNVRVNILMFNNQIYGLTKGQYSPTSEVAKVTKSTPFGSLDTPFNPVSLALGAEATFVARTHDMDRAHMQETFRRAHRAQRRLLRRGPAELQRLQRRGLREDHRQRGAPEHAHPAGARPADRLRRRGRAARGGAAVRRRARDRLGGRGRHGRAARPRREAGRPRPGLRPVPAGQRALRADADRRLPGRRAPRVRGRRCPSRSCRPRRSVAWATSARCCARAPAGRSSSSGRRRAGAGRARAGSRQEAIGSSYSQEWAGIRRR